MSTRTPAQAVAWARVQRTGFGGMCLQWSRMAYNVPARYGHARLAWTSARHRHVTSGWGGIPLGAPIFMDRSSSRWGHVAIFVGGGQMGTTDSSRSTTHVTNIQNWVNAGWRFLGWTEDLNGVRVLPAPGGGGGGGGGALVVDGVWGPLTQRRLQQVLGTTVDGRISGQVRGAWNQHVAAAQFVAANAARGSLAIAAVQRRVGSSADGFLGPNTIRAMQRHLGTSQDGSISRPSQMVRAMQRRLNEGRF